MIAAFRLEDISVGDHASVTHTFSQDDVLRFAAVTGDHSPLHVEPDYAAETEFGGNVMHGMLVASLFSRIIGMQLPGQHALFTGAEFAFRRPVRPETPVVATATVTSIMAATRTLTLALDARSLEGMPLITGRATVKVRLTDAPHTKAQESATRPVDPARVALVTGGSRGIGAAICRALARTGFHIAIGYQQNAAEAARVAEDVTILGVAAVPMPGDIRNDVEAARLIDMTAERFGGLAVVVNNAAGPFMPRSAQQLDWSDVQAQLDYHVKGPLQICRAAYPALKRSAGTIVNVLSQVIAGVPPAQLAHYTTAKHALWGLSKTLAAEWAADGIRVNTVSPSLVATDLTAYHGSSVFAMAARRTPLKRNATADDVASAVAYLVSDEARFLTGINLPVTGGLVMA